MGDRANIVLQQEDGSRVWLYTHSRGSIVPQVVQVALQKARMRWDDPSYVGRVVFQTLIGHDTSIFGFGLSTRIQDNDGYAVMVLDLSKQTVMFETEPGDEAFALPCLGKVIPFIDYIMMPPLSWDELNAV